MAFYAYVKSSAGCCSSCLSSNIAVGYKSVKTGCTRWGSYCSNLYFPPHPEQVTSCHDTDWTAQCCAVQLLWLGLHEWFLCCIHLRTASDDTQHKLWLFRRWLPHDFFVKMVVFQRHLLIFIYLCHFKGQQKWSNFFSLINNSTNTLYHMSTIVHDSYTVLSPFPLNIKLL